VRFPEYPTGDPNDCIQGEFEGYIDLEYEPGIVPGTPDDEVVSVFELTPRGGGQAQKYVRAGLAPVSLVRWVDPSPDRPGKPEGRDPSPRDSLWKPLLAPDQEYCATVTLYGRNDRVAPPVASEPICAPVMNIVWGRGPDAMLSDAAAPDDSGGKVAPAGPDAGAGAQPSGADAAAADLGAPSLAGGGCALAGPGRTALSPLPLLLLLVMRRLVRTARRGRALPCPCR
jgi:hypothetical protein